MLSVSGSPSNLIGIDLSIQERLLRCNVEYHEFNSNSWTQTYYIYDIFIQQHGLLMKVELICINTCKDHVKSSDASLKQYIFLQISVYSMPKYPLQS